MHEQKPQSPIYIGFIIAIIIIAIGIYYLLPRDDIEVKETGVITNNATTTNDTITASTTASVNVENNIKKDMNKVTIETNKGKIVFETYDNDAPKAVKNFIDLANKGFYNGVIFHRVIKGFMIQGGDPTGTGRGSPGYTFEEELNPNTESYKAGYKRGVVAMANAGANTNGSQFFIMHTDYPLPHNYTIFGKVIEGMEVVDVIANAKTDENDKPIEKILMNKVTVE